MKKRLQTLANLTLVAVLLVSLEGCKKKDEVLNPKPAMGTATIKGKVTGDINYNTAGDENLEGVTVIATVDREDEVVNPDNDYNYGTRVYSTVTDANGEYTLTIEVGDNRVDAYVRAQDKAFDVVQVTPSTPATVREVFAFGSGCCYGETHRLYKGSAKVSDFNW